MAENTNKEVDETLENAATEEENTAAEENVSEVVEDENTAEEDSVEEASEGDDEKKEKKSFFKKEKKKDKKDLLIEELTDKYKRTFAEFDNFRKRSEKEKSTMYEFGAKDIIEKILPVVDNFERGLASVPEEQKGEPFVEGMDKIYKQFMKVLEDVGVTPIEAVGKEFNPDFHNAVMHEENEEFGEKTISEELQKGYMYKESVVRHSMVKVAN